MERNKKSEIQKEKIMKKNKKLHTQNKKKVILFLGNLIKDQYNP